MTIIQGNLLSGKALISIQSGPSTFLTENCGCSCLIEVAIRSLWTNPLAGKYGLHGYLEFAYYSKSSRHVADLNSLKEEYFCSSDVFAGHYRTNYAIPDLPLGWIAAELMSIGFLARFTNNLKHHADKNEMASLFNIDASILVAFLYHLGHVRNICAHHGRIWNRRSVVQFSLPKKTTPFWAMKLVIARKTCLS